MVKGLYTGFTGMVNEQKRMDVTANNLANAATTGYKKEGMVNQSFDRELAIKIKDTSAYRLPQRIGGIHLGVKVGETYTDWAQGSYQVTDRPTDLAIAGDGFFAISFTSKNGATSIKYTRDGAFTVDNEGYLRTSDGDYVLNQAGAMTSNANAANYVRIDPNQEFVVNQQGFIFQNDQIVGQIGVVDVADYNYISKYGENLYDLTEGGQIVAANASVEQGCLEASNVNVIDEMVQMITIARAYEAGQKMIQTVDATLDKAVNSVGKI